MDNSLHIISTFTKLMRENDIEFFFFNEIAVDITCGKKEFGNNANADFYVFSKYKEIATELLTDNFQLIKDIEDNYKFVYGDITFVMWRQTAKMAGQDKKTYWNDIIDSYFDDVLDHVEIDGAYVPVLPPTLNAICLFSRVIGDSNHSVSEGRLKTLLNEERREINAYELSAKLKRLGMLNTFHSLFYDSASEMDEHVAPVYGVYEAEREETF